MTRSRWHYWRRFHLPSLVYVMALLAIALLSYWWIERDNQTPNTQKPAADRVDARAQGGEFSQVSDNGALRYAAKFEQVEHLANSDMRVQNIVLTTYNQTTVRNTPTGTTSSNNSSNNISINTAHATQGGEVVLRAATAIWHNDNRTLTLQGPVVMTRAAMGDNPALTLTTEAVLVNVRQGLASTDAPFTLNHGASTVQGQGIRYDYELRDLAMGKTTQTASTPSSANTSATPPQRIRAQLNPKPSSP